MLRRGPSARCSVLVTRSGVRAAEGVFAEGVFAEGVFAEGVFAEGVFAEGVFAEGAAVARGRARSRAASAGTSGEEIPPGSPSFFCMRVTPATCSLPTKDTTIPSAPARPVRPARCT